MSVKLIAAAIIVAGGAGAAVSYLQHNPGTFSALGPQFLEFRGPLASYGNSGGEYVPGKYYRLCRNEYATTMRNKSQAERREACRCFDKAFQSWSPAMQDAAKLAMHSAIVISKLPTSHEIINRYSGQNGRKPSVHERNVQKSQLRDTYGSVRRNYDEGLNKETVEKARANPITTTIATGRLTALAKRCKIVDAPIGIPDMDSVFKSVGSRR